MGLAAACAAGSRTAATALPVPAAQPALSSPTATAAAFQRFVLPNGLTLIVREEHAAPVAHLRVFYRVGEKAAGPGHTGYPHLFEHLAFSRTEHLDRSVWKFLESIGAREYDATTRYDYTHYFATVPVQALDTLLWLEAERMAHLAGALTDEDLRRSRAEVVQESERLLQVPFIQMLKATWDHTYPEGHPYAGFDIASEDLNRATLRDARRFYASYYHPANAVLVIAGDVNARDVRQKVEEHFGSIGSGPRAGRSEPRIARRSESHRQRIEGALPDARMRLVWNTPEWGTAAADHLSLAATILASRVRRELTASGVATEVESAAEMRELGGQVMLDVVARSSTDFPAIERTVSEEIRRLASEGPSATELEHARAQYRSQLEPAAADLASMTYLLGKAELFRGNPSHLQMMLRRIETATPEDVRQVVRMWLTNGTFVLEFYC
jgi:zinc protease